MELAKRLDGQQDSMAAGQGVGSTWSEAFLATDASIQAEEGCTATALLAWLDREGQACLQVLHSQTCLTNLKGFKQLTLSCSYQYAYRSSILMKQLYKCALAEIIHCGEPLLTSEPVEAVCVGGA